MRIARVHIQNFRCLQDFVLRVDPNLSVLVGPNNSGKSAFLRALDRTLGRGAQPFELDDFFVAAANVNPAQLPIIRIDIEIRPVPQAAFSPAFSAEFVDEIDFDNNGAPFVIFRTEATFDQQDGKAHPTYFSVKADGSVQGMAGRKRGVLRSYIPFYLADAFRDVLRELRDRRGLWGRLLDSVVLAPATRQAVDVDIRSINATILNNTPRLTEIRTRLSAIGDVIGTVAPPNDVEIHPVSIEFDELLRNLDVQLWTTGAPRAFSIGRHGEGTRNIAHLVVFRTFVDLIAREENDNMEAEPILGIEEPEVHLHPHARRAIAALLTQVPHQTFVSTHSAAIVREAQPRRVKLFRRVGSGCVVKEMPEQDPANPAQPYFDARQLAVISRLLRAGAAEALFAKCTLLFEGESEARAFPLFAQALGIRLNLLGISLVSVDGGTFGPMIRLLHHPAFDIPWVIASDGDNVLQFGRQLVNIGLVNAAALTAAQQTNRIREEVLLPNDWFTLPDGANFERAMLLGGAAPEYAAAIQTHIGPTALADFVATQPQLAGAAQAEQIYAFMRSGHGEKYKPLFAGMVADAITTQGTNAARIPQIFTDALTRAREYAEGTRTKP